jgi:hypothetical protein
VDDVADRPEREHAEIEIELVGDVGEGVGRAGVTRREERPRLVLDDVAHGLFGVGVVRPPDVDREIADRELVARFDGALSIVGNCHIALVVRCAEGGCRGVEIGPMALNERGIGGRMAMIDMFVGDQDGVTQRRVGRIHRHREHPDRPGWRAVAEVRVEIDGRLGGAEDVAIATEIPHRESLRFGGLDLVAHEPVAPRRVHHTGSVSIPR